MLGGCHGAGWPQEDVQEGLSACSRAVLLVWILQGLCYCLPASQSPGAAWPQGQQLPGRGGRDTSPFPAAATRAPPSPGHLVLWGLETLPSVSACLGSPARDPRPRCDKNSRAGLQLGVVPLQPL